MKQTKLIQTYLILIASLAFWCGCDDFRTSDQIQQKQQETILAEGTSQTGMPAIKNFRERKLLKTIL